jgi:hypothetical protein
MSQTPPKGNRAQEKEKVMVASHKSLADIGKDHIQSRLHALQEKLESAKDEDEKKNINAALEIYRQGKCPGQGMYTLTAFQDGRVVSLEDLDFGRPFHHEVRSLTYSPTTQFRCY